MKYLSMLKSQKGLPGELSKLPKAPFDSKDSTGGRHISENQAPEQDENPTRARGYGCAACGNRIYLAVEQWELSELPQWSPWKHEHRPVIVWQCEKCGAIFKVIGGSRGPQPFN